MNFFPRAFQELVTCNTHHISWFWTVLGCKLTWFLSFVVKFSCAWQMSNMHSMQMCHECVVEHSERV